MLPEARAISQAQLVGRFADNPRGAVLPDPAAVDARLRADGTTLREIRARIPKELRRPSELRSWLTLARVVACGAICLYLLAEIDLDPGWALLWQLPVLSGLWIAYGWVLVGLFVLGHDCGHFAFSRHRWVNVAVGYACLSPLWNSFETWRLTHDHHHANTQLRGQEVDWAANLSTRGELEGGRRGRVTTLGYAMPFGIFVWIYLNTMRRALLAKKMLGERGQKKARRLLVSNLVMAAILIAIYGGLLASVGLWGMIKYHGAPATVAMLTGSMIITIQHAHPKSVLYSAERYKPIRGQLASTFDVRFPRLLEWLWCKINLHIAHHVHPGVPWYHLEEAGREIRSAYPAYYQEYRFRPKDLAWMAKAPVLEHDEAAGYYLLAPR
jgi:acyl-lipid omega-6 desaturase (Delta-12 desaturase)